MGTLVRQAQGGGQEQPEAAKCLFCGRIVTHEAHCKHVRWTFDQGDPLDFARFALETSPYVRARGRRPSEIPEFWWNENAEWVCEQVMNYFDACDGFVFGELVDLDLLARDVWKRFAPENPRATLMRVDPV